MFYYNQPQENEQVTHVVLIYIILKCLAHFHGFLSYLSISYGYVYLNLFLVLIGLYFYYGFVRVLCKFQIHKLNVRYKICKYLHQFCNLSFTFLVLSFAAQKFLILMKLDQSYFILCLCLYYFPKGCIILLFTINAQGFNFFISST